MLVNIDTSSSAKGVAKILFHFKDKASCLQVLVKPESISVVGGWLSAENIEGRPIKVDIMSESIMAIL